MTNGGLSVTAVCLFYSYTKKGDAPPVPRIRDRFCPHLLQDVCVVISSRRAFTGGVFESLFLHLVSICCMRFKLQYIRVHKYQWKNILCVLINSTLICH